MKWSKTIPLSLFPCVTVAPPSPIVITIHESNVKCWFAKKLRQEAALMELAEIDSQFI